QLESVTIDENKWYNNKVEQKRVLNDRIIISDATLFGGRKIKLFEVSKENNQEVERQKRCFQTSLRLLSPEFFLQGLFVFEKNVRGRRVLLTGVEENFFFDFPKYKNVIIKKEMYEEALFQYELALQVALNMSSSVEVRLICHANRAACYQKLGKYDSTVKECTQALELNPAYIIKALARRGEAHDKLEHFEEAIADMKRILEIDPSNDQARKGICRLEPLAAEKREKMKEEMMDKIVHGHAFRKLPVYFASTEEKRTIATLPVTKKAQYSILLSGTPALFRPIELFKQMEALYPDAYKSGVFGVYQGVSNHEELHNLMKVTVMIRRLKKVVLSQLPVNCRQQVRSFISISSIQSAVHSFAIIMIGGGKTVKAKIKSVKSKDEGESLKFTHKNLIDKICTDSADAKIPAVLEYLGTFIEAGFKFLIFAHHQPMIDAIHECLLGKKVGCIRIDGGRPAASRQQLVTDFREEDSIKPSINAGGVGLTLTAASSYICRTILDSWLPISGRRSCS
ncbi:hypothetical protein S83_002836, partial [Arachis hypogaea]